MLKPARWSFSPHLISPEWRELWRHLQFVVPLWEGAGSPTAFGRRDLVTGTIVGTAGWAPSTLGHAENVPGGSATAQNRFNFADRDFLDLPGTALTLFVVVENDFGSSGDGNFRVIVDKSNNNADAYRLFKTDDSPNEIRFRLPQLSSPNLDSVGFTWSSGQRFSVAGTYDGATMRLFIDGKLNASQSSTGTVSGSTEDLHLGKDATFDNPPWDGRIIVVYGWSRALDAETIQRLHSDPFGPFRLARRALFPVVIAITEKIVAVGQVSETNLAQPVSTGAQQIAVGQVSETDLAQAIARLKTRSVGQVSETDLAQAIGRVKAKALGLVTEVDVAQAIASVKVKLLGQVTETDLAQAVGKLKAKTLGQVSETDLAQPVSTGLVELIGQVLETDAAQVVGKLKTKTLGQVSETDLAQGLDPVRVYVIAQVTETDLAQTIAPIVATVIGQVTEMDLAQAVGKLKTKTLGQVTETDLAQAVTAARIVDVNIVTETDAAFAVASAKLKTLGIVVESDVAIAVEIVGGALVVIPTAIALRAEPFLAARWDTPSLRLRG